MITHAQTLQLLRQALNRPDAQFQPDQFEAIEALVQQRRRLLVVQRTGWGKSMVYFLATRLLRDQGYGPTLLISPLLALMRNQIEAAERIGIRAVTINSANQEAWDQIHESLQRNEADILLISPERLGNDGFRDRLVPIAGSIGLFVVDEAHCISDWGHDFRPDYRRITRILQALPPNIPVLATTATANNRVVADVQEQLGANLTTIRGPLVRESLRLQNITFESGGQAARLAWLAEHVPQIPGSGIIYTLTVRDANRVAEWLKLVGIDAAAYYGDIDNETRVHLEQRLLNNRIKALVATSALGMGFDKPDLGFVIHFQRPGSVVHYYQQVGRAGRAIEQAYGILLSGHEDDEIGDYFIRTAFPPRAHIQEVMAALDTAENGLSVPMLEQQVNLGRGEIEKVLKILVTESPSPVTKQGSRWYATPVQYHPNEEQIRALQALRRAEQAQMREYMRSQACLMAFLRRALDDPHVADCGVCASCVGQPLLPGSVDATLTNQAITFLRRSDQTIDPRKKWPGADVFTVYHWRGTIPKHLQAEPGRALSLWGDAGWGALVRQGKQVDGRFSDELVQAATAMIRERWQPSPAPAWVTCVPSQNHPQLVPDFARRLAASLNLPYVECVAKTRHTQAQKDMQNSFQQAYNLDGAFTIRGTPLPSGPVLLLDDTVDSRWTFTIVTALLREAGAGPVFPVALAVTSAGGV